MWTLLLLAQSTAPPRGWRHQSEVGQANLLVLWNGQINIRKQIPQLKQQMVKPLASPIGVCARAGSGAAMGLLKTL